MKKLLTIALVAFGVNAFAQSVSIKSQKTFGGSADESSGNLIATKDGGFIMIGDTKSSNGDVSANNGGADTWVVKLDAGMNIQWQKSFGGNGDDHGYSIIQTNDGGYAFVTSGWPSSPSVIKIDAGGTVLWRKAYGNNHGFSFSSIEQTADGGYIAAGSYSYITSTNISEFCWVLKLDDTGAVQWQKFPLKVGVYQSTNSIHQTKDGGFIMGFTSDTYNGYGFEDYAVMKLDSLGEMKAWIPFGGNGEDLLNSMIQTKDDGYMAVGQSSSNSGNVSGNHGGNDCWVVKMDKWGLVQWKYCYGGKKTDNGFSACQAKDGGYVIVGESNSLDSAFSENRGGSDFWAFKIDSIGKLQWKKVFGGSKGDHATSVIEDVNGGYVITGTTGSSDGDVTGNHGGNDIWVVELQEDPLSVTGVVADNSVSIYPNPAEDNVTIKLSAADKGALFSINDITGKKLKEGKLAAAVTVLSVKDLPAGVYLLCIEGRQPFKLVKQ